MENKEPRLREAMDKLDTLSAGIVFDKEGAWNKLQERIEQHPKKSIKLYYWSAAAASILLLFFVFISNNAPEQTIVNTPTGITQQPHDNIAPAQELPIVIQQDNTIATNTPKRKKSVPTHKPELTQEQVTTTVINTPLTVQPEPTNNTPTEAIVAVKKPMKVMHINDIETEEQITQELKSPIQPKSATAKISIPILRINNAHVDNEHRNSLLYIQ